MSTLDGRHKLRGLRPVIVVGMCLLVSALLVLMVIPSNPLRKSEKKLHAWVLAETPMGSSMEDVAKAIERQKWQRDPGHNEELGFYRQQGFIGVVGSKSIHADLGDYREWHFPIVGYKDWATWANVEAYWGFDEHGKLIDIWVRKSWDFGF